MYTYRANRRNERRNENDRKKEKNCKLGVFGTTSNFNIIIGGLDFNILVRRLETRNLFLNFDYWNNFV